METVHVLPGNLSEFEADPDVTGQGVERSEAVEPGVRPPWSGFLYLAVVLDMFSRRIVGWSSIRSALKERLERGIPGQELRTIY